MFGKTAINVSFVHDNRSEVIPIHEWESLNFSSTPQEKKLEKKLHWPTGTLSILKQAFDQKIPRNRVWVCPNKKTKALPFANQIYKRGPTQSSQQKISYDISLFNSVKKVMAHLDTSKSFYLIDQNVSEHFKFLGTLKNKLIISVSESQKNLEQLSFILENIPSSSPSLICIGGGNLLDIGGFAASLKKLKLFFVPTTLLSMVDASIGGKTGINFSPYGKNQLGSYYFPEGGVFISPEWLSSLPKEEFYSGGTECLKHALIAGNRNLINQLTEILAHRDLKKLSNFLLPLIQIKSDIVSKDPLEKNDRRILNLGHTLGHALEFYSAQLLHGECVALGIYFAALLSQSITGLSDENVSYIFSTLKNSGCLPSYKKLVSSIRDSSEIEISDWLKIYQLIFENNSVI